MWQDFELNAADWSQCQNATLLWLLSLWQSSDLGLSSILVLLNLTGAFETFDHTILRHCLESNIGITGIALQLFRPYFLGRMHTINYNNSFSSCHILSCGVPQGSVLAPLLFSLYMLPLSNILCELHVNFNLYADDTYIYIPNLLEDPDHLPRLECCLSLLDLPTPK